MLLYILTYPFCFVVVDDFCWYCWLWYVTTAPSSSMSACDVALMAFLRFSTYKLLYYNKYLESVNYNEGNGESKGIIWKLLNFQVERKKLELDEKTKNKSFTIIIQKLWYFSILPRFLLISWLVVSFLYIN